MSSTSAGSLSRLRRPVVAIPTALAVVALGLLGFWFAQRRADIRWAREVALPEIERIIEDNDVWRNLVPPYRLAEQAEAILGDDPELADLFSQVSLDIDVVTEPPGASVYMKEYGDPDGGVDLPGRVAPGAGPDAHRDLPLEAREGGVRDGPGGGFHLEHGRRRRATSPSFPTTWSGPWTRRGAFRREWCGCRPPKRPVGTLDDFFIGRYEVTNREYKAFVDAGGYRNRDYWKHPFLEDGRELTWEEAISELVDPSGQPGPSTWMAGDYPEGQGEHPVSGVSWYEAAAYAEYAGMSLPTRFHWLMAMGYFTPMIRGLPTRRGRGSGSLHQLRGLRAPFRWGAFQASRPTGPTTWRGT